ncbi:MAG: hypothetical protein NZ556_00390 [Fimbriimonadales bacterium]|nr:hypothetical protein [Fimbriimonadales bacterium]
MRLRHLAQAECRHLADECTGRAVRAMNARARCPCHRACGLGVSPKQRRIGQFCPSTGTDGNVRATVASARRRRCEKFSGRSC